MFGSKKGGFVDIIMIIVTLVGLSISLLVFYKIFGEINTGLQDSDMTTESKEIAQTGYTKLNNIYDNMFLAVFVGLWLGVLLTSFMLDTHPAMFFVFIFLLIIFLVVAASLANVYMGMAEETTFATVNAGWTFIPFIMQNFVKVIMMVGFSVAVVLYGKAKTSV